MKKEQLNWIRKRRAAKKSSRPQSRNKKKVGKGKCRRGKEGLTLGIDSELLEAQHGIASQNGGEEQEKRVNLATDDLDRRHVD